MIRFRSKLLFAVGGNTASPVGDPKSTIREAAKSLVAGGVVIRRTSRFFRTPCFPAGAGPSYVNAAFAAETDLGPHDVLAVLHDVEREFARSRTERWGSRTLDLDLLAFRDAVLPDVTTHRHWLNLSVDDQKQTAPGELILPHPRVQDRGFVLVPLCDVAPDWRHPVLDKTVAQMCADLPESERGTAVPL